MSILDIMSTEETTSKTDDNKWFEVEYSEDGEVLVCTFGLDHEGVVVDSEGYPMNTSCSVQSQFNSFMSAHIQAVGGYED